MRAEGAQRPGLSERSEAPRDRPVAHDGPAKPREAGERSELSVVGAGPKLAGVMGQPKLAGVDIP